MAGRSLGIEEGVWKQEMDTAEGTGGRAGEMETGKIPAMEEAKGDWARRLGMSAVCPRRAGLWEVCVARRGAGDPPQGWAGPSMC